MGFTVIYKNCCPRCGSDISNQKIVKGYCDRCEHSRISEFKVSTYDMLNKEVENFTEFFTKLTDFRPWPLQRYWIKRLISGESFAMVAPTGVGKSTLLVVYALYRAYFYRSKVYIVTPTKEIAKQIYNRISEFAERGGLKEIRVVFYDSTSKNTDAVKTTIGSGNFDILITSAAFLIRHQDLILNKRFELIIADDLDSLIKSSKSVDKILSLLGFNNTDIDMALRIIKLRQNILISKMLNKYETVEKLEKELAELEAILKNNIAKKNAQLVVASATGRAKGLKTRILKFLLGFDAGAVFEYWRNIVDMYYPLDNDFLEVLTHIVKKLGSGMIFVSPVYREVMNDIVERLRSLGLRVEIAKSGNKALERFRKGEIDIVIGSASYYGILVRGIDEPIRVRYTIFIGVPCIIKDVWTNLSNPRFLYMVLKELKHLGYKVNDMLDIVASVISKSTPSMLYLYAKIVQQDYDGAPLSEEIVNNAKQLAGIRDYVYKILKDVLSKTGVLSIGKSCVVVEKQGKYLMVVPDPYTYIQASGRCSRLLGKSKTFGISIIFEKYLESLSILENTLRRYIHMFSLKKLVIEEVDGYIDEIEKSRANSNNADILEIHTALVIVESPTKAKTIANMFGKPAKRVLGNVYIYETLIPLSPSKIILALVMPSFGHITDLVVDEGIYGVKIVSNNYVPVYNFITRCRACKSQFVGVYELCPYCNSLDISSSSSVYNVMRALAMQVDKIFIATDPDTEGEKIAFDIYNLLLPYNRNIYRIEFKEVTREAILNALCNPRGIDLRKVEAQIARRIADRWIGFEASLWLQLRFNKPWLGAGRVQSPVLLWVSSRFKEYKEKMGYIVIADIGGYSVRIHIPSGTDAKSKAEDLAKNLMENGLDIKHIEFVEKTLSPPPPFTTDTLIQDANILLGYSATKTMILAQTLFELGLITYHRTDSTRISEVGINIAREILKKLGLEHMFTPRSWNMNSKEGAHESIRPTRSINAEELVEMIIKGDIGFLTRISDDHIKIYDLVFRRFIASQMPSAKIKYLRAKLSIDTHEIFVEVPTEVVAPGFTLIYPIKLYSNVLRNLDIDTGRMKVSNVKIVKGSGVTLYRVADIVKMMKEEGIGRPSTYAKAIDNNIRHGYILLSKKRKVLIPTKLGLDVAEVISRHFIDLVGEEVTRELEEVLDRIEVGELDMDYIINIVKDRIDNVIKDAELAIASSTLGDINALA